MWFGPWQHFYNKYVASYGNDFVKKLYSNLKMSEGVNSGLSFFLIHEVTSLIFYHRIPNLGNTYLWL